MSAPVHRVFYSWQSDLPGSHNRNFIEGAIEAALKQLNARSEIEVSPRPELALDKDTMGVPGSPPITETIVQKIKDCSVFVGDLSFVAQSLPQIVSEEKPVKYSPNSNVVIEHTHALDFHGVGRIIAVANEAYGGPLKEDSLPFNLRHRKWPIRYRLGPETTPEEKQAARKQLIADLAGAIRLILAQPIPLPHKNPFVGTNFMPSEFARQAQSRDLIVDGPYGEEMQPYSIPEGRAITLRLQPTETPTRFETEGEAFEAALRGHLRPMAPFETTGQSPARNAMGAIVYEAPRNGRLFSLSQLFLSKEIYGLDAGAAGTASQPAAGGAYAVFQIERVEESYALTLQNYLRFARTTLELPLPWRISVGAYGIHNLTIAGRRCLRHQFDWSIAIDREAPVLEILTPCFISLWKIFTATRPANANERLEKILAASEGSI